MYFFFSLFFVFVNFDLSFTFDPTGCYATSPSNLDTMTFQFDSNSGLFASKCVSFCMENSFPYAGISKGSSCSCGHEFGLTTPVLECNISCADGFSCGGPDAYSAYYVLDKKNKEEQKFYFPSESLDFQNGRKKCVAINGDLVGRKLTKEQSINSIKSLIDSSSSSSSPSKIWAGLRIREVDYEWVDERQPTSDSTYVKNKNSFIFMWSSQNLTQKCVIFDLKEKKFSSEDCSASHFFVCLFINITQASSNTSALQTLTEDSGTSDESKTLALYIVMPLFIICYGGACLLYCGQKTLKHCFKKGGYVRHVRVPNKDQEGVISSSRKTSINPTVTQRQLQQQQQIPLQQQQQPLSYPFPMTPAEEKKLKLLENASKEAKERKQGYNKPPQKVPVTNETPSNLLPPLSATKPRVSPVPPSSSSVPPKKNTSNKFLGKSINEILRNKMTQQTGKKKKKIIAS